MVKTHIKAGEQKQQDLAVCACVHVCVHVCAHVCVHACVGYASFL